MTGDQRVLGGVVRLLAVVAVLSTLGAGVGAAVVQAREEPRGAAGGGTASPSPGVPDPFLAPAEGFDYRNWVDQRAEAAGYRLPGGWHVAPAERLVEARDVDDAVVARGSLSAYYYGNRCTDTEPVAGAFTVLAEPVAGSDPKAAAEDAVLAWARSYNHNSAGVEAAFTDPVTRDVTLADGSEATRSWVSIDMSVFSGTCLPERAEVAVTTVARGEQLVSLVQGRYVLEQGGVSDAQWSAIAASLRVE